MNKENVFYCYSLRLFHYISAFGERCYGSKINTQSKNRYWIFMKSDRLDRIIESYNRIKYSIS